MRPIQINPNAIKAGVKTKFAGGPKAVTFGDVLDAAAPASYELVSQATGGSQNMMSLADSFFSGGAVLNAAFSGIESSGRPGYGGYGAYSQSPGLMGTPRYTTQPGYYSKYTTTGTDTVPGTDLPTADLMNMMNQNNLQLLELQALMQSNLQEWQTKSAITKADHDARISIIRNFRVG